MASSKQSYAEPRAIPILTYKPNGKVRVHHDAVQMIFRRPEVTDKPVCIVSIAGAFRKGKSFMLNFFIRYLRNKGYINKSWMGDEDKPMMDGFDWKGGRNACTNGILVWSEVFMVKRNDDEVAVILMDTQGLFETRMGHKTNSIIFALSTLISSVQIFNLTQQIQESDLGFLQFFTAYAEAARKESSDENAKPFQSLIFLVRDWQHAAQLAYGTVGGEQYLKEVLSNDTMSEELSSVRKYLRSSFDDTRCCLMPYPGQKVSQTSDSFNGCLEDIAPEFLHQTASFVDSLFRPQNLVVKTINGQVVSALAILQYVSDCSASLTDGKLPDPKTMMENVAEAQNFEAQRRCSEMYTQNMKALMGESFVEDDLLLDIHSQALSSAMTEFAGLTRFGGEKSRRKHREYLETTISREYGMIVQANHSLKVNAESDLMNLIEVIADQYEENMKAATDRQEFISDLELDVIHGRFWNESYEAYSKTDVANSRCKEKYVPKLLERLEQIYGTIKSENNEKRRIGEEQNEQNRRMMKLELECVIQYREKMRKHVQCYAEETDLKQTADGHRKTILDEFKIRCLDERITPDSKTFSDRHSSLETKLNQEYDQIMQINEEKKVILKKSLESHRNKAIVDYESAFKMILKDTYMEKEDLIRIHGEVVERTMASVRNAVGTSSSLPLVAAHLVQTESELRNKYPMVDEWNEKNSTFFRKCFKVIKTVVGVGKDILEVVASVGKLMASFKIP